ncbi:hypothetical protein MHU86_18375 [Fragilaria crotonensis]|nr:hypothetical protein MHU86_18375 [Fragilaria crotonensis]
MSKSNIIASRSSFNDSDEFSCVDLYAVVEGRAGSNPQRAVVAKVKGKNELTTRVNAERLQRVADHDTEHRKMIRAQALEERSGRRLEQVQQATYPATENHRDKDKAVCVKVTAVSVKVTSCNGKIESSDKPRFKPSCSSSQSMISHRSPAPAPRSKYHDNRLRSPGRAPTSNHHATLTATVGAKVSAEHEHTRARLRNSIDKSLIACLPDLHQSSSPVPRRTHATNNGGNAYLAEHRRARRRNSIDNGFTGLQPELHHSPSSAPRSRCITSSVPNAPVSAQDPAERTRARRRSSIDNGSIAFLPDHNQSPSPAPRSRLDTDDEPTVDVGARVPGKGTRARRKSSIDIDFITFQPDLAGPSPSSRKNPSSQSVQPQNYCRSKG